MKLRAVGYLRRSREDSQADSIEIQKEEVTDYADANGYQIVYWYIDDGISGHNTDRDDFVRMIEDAEHSNEFQSVLVRHQSRFARFRPSKTIRYLDRLDDAGVKLVTTKQATHFQSAIRTPMSKRTTQQFTEGLHMKYSSLMRCGFLMGLVAVFYQSAQAQSDSELPQEVFLYQGDAPGSEGLSQEPKKVRPGKDRVVTNVHRPLLYPYLPSDGTETGMAVIIAPGGGHNSLWSTHEGHTPAKYFAEHGIAAFVLEYRLAEEHGSKYTVDYYHAVPAPEKPEKPGIVIDPGGAKQLQPTHSP